VPRHDDEPVGIGVYPQVRLDGDEHMLPARGPPACAGQLQLLLGARTAVDGEQIVLTVRLAHDIGEPGMRPDGCGG
jgi:hypothetical protein